MTELEDDERRVLDLLEEKGEVGAMPRQIADELGWELPETQQILESLADKNEVEGYERNGTGCYRRI